MNRSANLTLLNSRGGPRGGRPNKTSCAAAVAGPHRSLAPHAERSVKYRGNIDSNTCHRRRMENPIPKLNFYDMFVFFSRLQKPGPWNLHPLPMLALSGERLNLGPASGASSLSTLDLFLHGMRGGHGWSRASRCGTSQEGGLL